jgi:hypothetical protein
VRPEPATGGVDIRRCQAEVLGKCSGVSHL